jgi:hypothetical protein
LADEIIPSELFPRHYICLNCMVDSGDDDWLAQHEYHHVIVTSPMLERENELGHAVLNWPEVPNDDEE